MSERSTGLGMPGRHGTEGSPARLRTGDQQKQAPSRTATGLADTMHQVVQRSCTTHGYDTSQLVESLAPQGDRTRLSCKTLPPERARVFTSDANMRISYSGAHVGRNRPGGRSSGSARPRYRTAPVTATPGGPQDSWDQTAANERTSHEACWPALTALDETEPSDRRVCLLPAIPPAWGRSKRTGVAMEIRYAV